MEHVYILQEYSYENSNTRYLDNTWYIYNEHVNTPVICTCIVYSFIQGNIVTPYRIIGTQLL